ncbi:MAG: type VI secretion system tip protein TssI/VgrG [Byssovorax sp.]
MDSFSVKSGAFVAVQWTVLSIVGEEALSELSSFTIHLLAPRSQIESAAHDAHVEPFELLLVGQTISFHLDDDGIERFGVVAAARIEAPVERNAVQHSRVRVEVVPRAWLLTQRRNSRIFQGIYVHQIVSAVLAESGVKHRWSLGNTYPKRVYCTQYDETDYEFVTRLLAEEGILFFFNHEQSFAGGPTPTNAVPDPSGWETASKVLGAVGTVASGIGGAVPGVLGSAASMFGDLFKPKAKDEEADDPMVIGAGVAGPAGPGDVFVFIDQPAFYPDCRAQHSEHEGLTLQLRDEGGLDGDHFHRITELAPSEAVRTRRIEVRDYDFRRPMLLLQARTESATSALGDPREAVAGDPPLEIYDHHGEYEKPEVNSQMADLHLQQARRDAVVMAGRGSCPNLSPGHKFQLQNRTASHLADGGFAVTRVHHESFNTGFAQAGQRTEASLEGVVDGVATAIHEALATREPLGEEAIRAMIRRQIGSRQQGNRTYQNRFDCVPSSLAHRPPRPRRITRNVTESATVVGPVGIPAATRGPVDPTAPAQQDSAQEIYTDRFGRVKIQFHWDREGQWKENSSCWVRVAQTWAGAGFGFQFIPRIGMEVLVTFLGGDPDRPVIIGSLYNATHLTPEPLPQRLTRSGIRTQSSPGGGGFNELSFEDAAGVERVLIHAQKDFEEIVNDTHNLNVKGDQRVTVGATQRVGVAVDQVVAVGQNLTTLVGKSHSETVRGNHTTHVLRNDTSVVTGDSFQTTTGVAARTASSDDLTVVEGDRNVTVRGNLMTHVGGRSAEQKSSTITYVNGSSFLTATERVLLKAEKADGDGSASVVRLECGDSFIEVHHDKITLSARTIELLGGDTVKLKKGKEAQVLLDSDGAAIQGDPITLQTPTGSKVLLDGGHLSMIGTQSALIHAIKIALESGQASREALHAAIEQATHTPNVKLVFTHMKTVDAGNRIKNTKYRVVVEDQVYDGVTDGQGELKVWAPDGAKVVHVILWANESFRDLYPHGPLVWLVHLVTEFPAETTPKGARLRLRNLGYDPGTVLVDDTLDDLTQQALLEFQLDQEIPMTAELEDATKKKLSEQYGSWS